MRRLAECIGTIETRAVLPLNCYLRRRKVHTTRRWTLPPLPELTSQVGSARVVNYFLLQLSFPDHRFAGQFGGQVLVFHTRALSVSI